VQRVWSLGDLGKLAAHNSPLSGKLLCEELDLRASERVLDVAAGTGPTSIAPLSR
jgi:protein-L-isoaspartate O-methyltransferase